MSNEKPLSSAPAAAAAAERPAVRFEGISKRFGGTVALDQVGFDVAGATVHALLGGNGSGKSTLIKILCGVYHGDSGTIEVNGQAIEAHHTSAEWARAANIHVVHQGVGVFRDLTVADNFALAHGYGTRSFAPIATRRLERDVRAILTRFDLDISPRTRMSELSPALQTMVAVARAVPNEDAGPAVIVLDEPTAVLPTSQEQLLLEAVRGYRRRGHTVVLVTHRLDEVVAVADTATFLRDGRVLETSHVGEIDEQVMVRRIAGLDRSDAPRRVLDPQRERRLELRGLSVGPLHGIDLHADVGEIVGLSGLEGSGRTELMHALFGVKRPRDGAMTLDGRPLKLADPADAVTRGIAYVSDERQREGIFGDQSVRENLSIADLHRYWRRLWLWRRQEARDARAVIDGYGVVAAGHEALLSSMSGGNQQKVAIARWLELAPRLLLLNEPTQGVDVGARAAIHDLVRGAAARGATVLVSSSDARELAELCDRVVGVYRGSISGEAAGHDVTAERCLALANGGSAAAYASHAPRAG